MRHGNKKWHWLAFILTLTAGIGLPQPASAAGGLTVTPATAILSLAKNETEQKSTLTITNAYQTAAVLRFSFAPPEHATDRDRAVIGRLSVSHPEVTIGPNASFAQTITLSASDRLAPGSQQASLVITQFAAGGAVGVLPELRLPLILVNEDGAVTRLNLTGISRPAIAITPPDRTEITLENDGNMIATPRGYVTVTAPGGGVTSRGTINTASTALAPGARTTYEVALTPLNSAALPGPYTVTANYGLGGGQAGKTGSARFVFIAWWHVIAAAALVAAAYTISHYVLPGYLTRRQAAPATGKGRA